MPKGRLHGRGSKFKSCIWCLLLLVDWGSVFNLGRGKKGTGRGGVSVKFIVGGLGGSGSSKNSSNSAAKWRPPRRETVNPLKEILKGKDCFVVWGRWKQERKIEKGEHIPGTVTKSRHYQLESLACIFKEGKERVKGLGT